MILGVVLGGVLGSKAANKSSATATALTDPPDRSSTADPSSFVTATTPSNLTSTTTSSGPVYTGPKRSEEWHYIYARFEGINASLTAI